MPASLRKSIGDIQQALAEVDDFAKGKSLADYLADTQLRRAVEREFIIVGEVMSRIVHRFPETRARIDHARKIANFRHFLVHEYDEVDDHLVWDIVTRSAPVLKSQIDGWAAELDRA